MTHLSVYRVEYWTPGGWRHWATYLYRAMAHTVADRISGEDGYNVRVLEVPAEEDATLR